MKNKAFVFILLMISSGFCGESKVLNYIGKFLPNFTEIAFVTDVVNVYMQVSGFVRQTNTLLKSVKQTQQQWSMLTNQIEDMYGTLKSLKDVNLYDMDSWSQTLDRGEVLLRYDLKDVMQSFNMTEYYSLGATERYLNSIQNLDDYQKAMEAKRASVKKLFITDEYQNAVSNFTQQLVNYKGATKQMLEEMLANEQNILQNTTDPEKKAESQQRIDILQSQIQS